MAGKYHLVEGVAAVFKLERDPVRVAAHPQNRRVQVQRQAVAQFFQNGADILPRAARHHVPLRTLGNIQQAVMVKEAQEERQRETLHLLQ